MIPPPITPGGKKIEGYQCEKTWYIYRKKKKTLNENNNTEKLELISRRNK